MIIIVIMERRTSIRKIASFIGMAASLPSLAGMMVGCFDKREPEWAPLILTKQQKAIISALSDCIIPPTDTSGAIDAGVPGFIEVLLKEVFRVQDARKLLFDLESFDKDCKFMAGNLFVDCSSEQQNEWLKKVSDASNDHSALFRKIRELVLGAYFTSEEGMKQNLNYVPIPQKFEVCLPMDGNAKLMVGDRI